MTDATDTYKLPNGHTLRVYQDMSAESPREWGNLCEMHCFHNNYVLGDETDIKTEDYESFDEMVRANTLPSDIILNLYLYDHGGISMSYTDFGDKWDSGQVGFAVVPVNKIVSEYGDDSPESREIALRVMKAEIETYNHYLTGACYGYIITEEETCNLGHTHETEIDSCWGFYGYDYSKNGLFAEAGFNYEEFKGLKELG